MAVVMKQNALVFRAPPQLCARLFHIICRRIETLLISGLYDTHIFGQSVIFRYLKVCESKGNNAVVPLVATSHTVI